MAGSTGRKISTFIELGGEQAFRQAMNEAARSVRVLDADMKAVSSEFKTTGDAQQYMADKSALLRSKIEQQEKIVKMLSEAVKASAGQYGEASAKTDGYRIKLSNATAKLFDMRRELETADREAEEFGRDSVKVGRQIERGIGEGAEDAQKSMKGLIEQMQADIGSIKGGMAFSIASQVTSTITSIVQGVESFVNENSEQARRIEKFKAAAQMGNHNADQMMELLYDLTGFIGDQDTAMEALTTLMQTGLTSDDMKTAIKKLKELSVQFGEEGKIEDLAESLQESVRTEKVTGKIAEVIGRLGLSEDAANTLLKEAQTSEARTIQLMAYISGKGNPKALEEYEKSIEPLSDMTKSQAELDNAQAELAKAVAPAVTKKNEFFAESIKGITESLQLWLGDDETTKEIMDKAEERNKKLEEESRQKYKEFFEGVGKWLGDFGAAFLGGDSEKEEVDDSARSQAKEYADAAIQELDGRRPEINDIIQAAFGPGNEEENRAAAVAMIQAMQPTEEEKTELYNALTSMGIDAAMLFDEAFSTSMDTAAQNAYTSGANAGNMLNSGLNASLSGALDTAVNYASQINAALSSIGAGALDVPIYGAGYHINGASGGGIPGINFTSQIKLNGRQIAQVVDRYQGRKSSRLG